MKFLICLLTVLIVQQAHGQLTYETVWVDYDSAWEYKSLQLIPIRPKFPGGHGQATVSLSRAIASGMVTLSERGTASTENVHWLRIRNRSNQTIFVASGQTFTGGRQDRMVTRDTLLQPTRGDQYISVMCIEEGRWSAKERKIAYGQYANAGLRKVLDRSRNQVLIWKEIFAQLDSARLRSPTLAYTALRQDKEYQLQEQDYAGFFREKFKQSDSSITGFVCISGDKVIGCDIFADRHMFYDELEPLLQGYICEALLNGSAPLMDRDAVKSYMDQVLANEIQQEEFCKKNGKIFRSNNRVIHVSTY